MGCFVKGAILYGSFIWLGGAKQLLSLDPPHAWQLFSPAEESSVWWGKWHWRVKYLEYPLKKNVKHEKAFNSEKIKVHHEYVFLFFVTLQTDDKGVFCTDLSQEYQLAASTFGLSREAVWKLSQQAIDCIFAPDAVKQQLRQKWADTQPQVFKWPVH